MKVQAKQDITNIAFVPIEVKFIIESKEEYDAIMLMLAMDYRIPEYIATQRDEATDKNLIGILMHQIYATIYLAKD